QITEAEESLLLTSPQKLVVLNFSYAAPKSFAGGPAAKKKSLVDTLVRLRSLLSDKGKTLAFVQCPQALQTELSALWTGKNLFFDSLTQAYCCLGSPLLEIERELMLLTNAVKEVFSTQFNLKIEAEKPKRLNPNEEGPVKAEVIGLMPLKSPGS